MNSNFSKIWQITKYTISGGTGAAVHLSVLYLLTKVVGVWYILSTSIAFIIAFFVSFTLQKYWTFKMNEFANISNQLIKYFFVGVINLFLNAGLMYVLVDVFHLWYMLAQIIVLAFIGGVSFLVYKFFVFKHRANKLHKIIIATGVFPPDAGGPATYAKNLLEALRGRGFEAKAVFFKLEKKLPTGLRHLCYFFRLLTVLSGAELVIALDIFSAGFPAVLAALLFNKKVIVRVGGDFLWENFVNATGSTLTLKEFYADLPQLSLKHKIIYKLQKFIFNKCSALVLTTPWIEEIYRDSYKLNLTKIFYIENYYGPKLNSQEPVRKTYLWSGRKNKLKNTELLEKAFAEAQTTNPNIELKMMSNVAFEKLQKEIGNCYAFVLPSLSEVSPNLLLESMQYNKPFIATIENGLYEKLKNVGIFVNPKDKDDIKNKILFLAEEGNYQELKHKIENFTFAHSWDDIGGEFVDIYKSL